MDTTSDTDNNKKQRNSEFNIGGIMARDKEINVELKAVIVTATETDSKTVIITFKENRKFELYVKGIQYIFEGAQSLPFPASDLSHPDFIQQEKNFSVSYISKGEK
jgi:hypothetical protein